MCQMVISSTEKNKVGLEGAKTRKDSQKEAGGERVIPRASQSLHPKGRAVLLHTEGLHSENHGRWLCGTCSGQQGPPLASASRAQ